MGAISLIALLVAAIAFSAGGILIGKILVKGSTNPQKGQPYECGIPTNTSQWRCQCWSGCTCRKKESSISGSPVDSQHRSVV